MRQWKIAILKDTARPMLGLHGLHVAFRGLPDVEVVAHVDSNTDNLADKLRQTQARRHHLTLEAMFERESPDILVVCSRHPDDHLPAIEAAAAHGCHVYCEKPLASTLEDADRIIELVDEAGITVAMAHPGRHALSFRTMRRMIASGHIGSPVTAYGRGKCDHRGGGEDLVVLGTHILDLMAFFFGPPRQVFARITTQGRPITRMDRAQTVEPIGPSAGDRIFASLAFADGVQGVFESSRGLFQSRPCMGLAVSGTRGMLSLRFGDGTDEDLKICRHPGAPEDDVPYEIVPLEEDRVIPGAAALDYTLCGQRDIPRARMFLEANRFAAWDLMQSIDAGRPPVASLQDARLVMEVIQAMYASHFSDTNITLPLADRVHPLQ